MCFMTSVIIPLPTRSGILRTAHEQKTETGPTQGVFTGPGVERPGPVMEVLHSDLGPALLDQHQGTKSTR